MKLILKQYLSSLKERGELDALIPDLLAQMGLNVFSKPGVGNRQYGVDVAAVGKVEKDEKAVYLLSIKPGNLGRTEWARDGKQDIRPSLDEIIDVYVSTHLPSEHKGMPVKVCICIGGDVNENVRLNITQYQKKKKEDQLDVIIWDGDLLAGWVSKYFMREEIFNGSTRSHLRKSLALIKEPESSFVHFRRLTKELLANNQAKPTELLQSLRQLNICLWVLYAWSRDEENMESAYLAAEYSLLQTWERSKHFFSKRGKRAQAVQAIFASMFQLNTRITSFYCMNNILPHSGVYHGLSVAVNSRDNLDINLKLFDVLGRLGVLGLDLIWNVFFMARIDKAKKEHFEKQAEELANRVETIITNNPTLSLPIKDDQGIDISITILFMWIVGTKETFLKKWLNEMVYRAEFTYEADKKYPCNLNDYQDLLDHPKTEDNYKEEVTQGSILYPTIAYWAAMLNDEVLYKKLEKFQSTDLKHCNFQYWFPNESTEDNFYTNDGSHGSCLSDIDLSLPLDDYKKHIWKECVEGDTYNNLSAVKYSFWTLVFIACRHYRLPPPLYMTIPSTYTEKHVGDEVSNEK